MSSFAASWISGYPVPVYAAMIVSSVVPEQVSIVTLPVIEAVYRYQTEFSGSGLQVGVQTGTFSFGSPVAATVVPVTMPDPFCACASARSSFGGKASVNESVKDPKAPLVFPATAM